MPAFPKRSLAVSLVLLAGGCAHAPDAAPPPGFLTGEGEAAYHAFIAELAYQRGDRAVAAAEYLEAARASDDAAIAERAAVLAYTESLTEIAEEASALWLERAPDDVDAHRMHVSLAVQTGRPEDAPESLEYLLEQGPEDREDAWLLLMYMLSQEDNGPAALAALALAVEAHAEEAEAHFALAALALDKGMPARAVDSALRAVELRPDWPRAGLMLARAQLAHGDDEAGIATARAVIETYDDDAVLLEYAGLLADAGRHDDARAALADLLERQPDMPDALLAAGLLELREGHPEAARVHLTSLLGTGQRRLDALYYLGNVAQQLGESANALQLYLRIRSGRHFPSAQIQIGRLLYQLDQRDAALEHLRTFAQRFPRHSESAVLVEGGMLIELDREQEALTLYDDTLEEDPEARGVRYARALLLERLDRVDEALDDLYTLVEEDPEDGSALNALGYTLADRTGRYEEALGYIERALEYLPEDGAVLDSMGWVQYRLGNYEAALRYLEQAFGRVQDAEIAAHLGEVYWVMGETSRAREIWEDALSRTTDNRTLNETMRRFLGTGDDA